ncbi:putative 2-aminoethylphosphonate ABC transporter substrate-binding protein [Vibrio japonicus]|uniref:2-aminoethylphosphonate ABC transporter substrate-binding protein n=1 Tax=Vibrio japonicus TaxID=1824638 RepID=A0ABY5LJW1_9VIBR|nr:putative 2-aminoethylphosphonate ABC transporter substrate-binding protein [Vibrio japonicus]UUM32368.1 putative 2-aminoethylphosphonate ABC transporter substrate-binding protein [Vibrio japonicus]
MDYKIKTAALLLALAAPMANAATELTVYTAIESDQLSQYKKAFESQYPDIEIKWVRDSTGIMTAKILAEKDNPQADVVWGLSATSMMVFDNLDMLQAYKPKGSESLYESFRDMREQPTWVGMDAWIAGICVNTIELEKNNLEMPKSWADLTKPEYKGHIVMPNPSSSGTGFLDVSAWLQLFGEDQGWSYMDKLHKNIARYTHSGSQPCHLAATGETTMGVSFAFRGAKLKKQKAPIDLVFPTEGIGWDMEAAAIVKGTDKLEAAQKLMDFAVSKEANKLYNASYAVVALPGIAKPIEHYPEKPEAMMIKNNFKWAAANRDSILKEWINRYDSKSDAKN